MENLFIGSNGSVACIDPASGDIRWEASLKTGSILASTAYKDVSVLVRGSIVFAGCAGHLYCIDADSGTVLWHNPLSGFGHNDVSLAMEGVSVQFLAKTEKGNSG